MTSNRLFLIALVLVAFTSSLSTSAEAAIQPDPSCTFPAQRATAWQPVDDEHAARSSSSSVAATACERGTGVRGMEPMVVVNQRGTLFMGMPTEEAVLTQKGFLLQGKAQSYLLRSRNDGRTWTKLKLPVGVAASEGVPYVDPTTNRLFVTSTNLALSPCGSPVIWSDDEGATWKQAKIRPGCSPITIGDWPKIFTGPFKGRAPGTYPNAVYVCNDIPNILVSASLGCWRSDNGGETFTFTGFLPTLNVACRVGKGANSVGKGLIATVIHGTGQVLRNGDVVVPIQACGRIITVKSVDQGKTWKATDTGSDSGGLLNALTGKESLAQNIFMNMFFDRSLAQDAKGNLFLAYVRDGVHLAVSRDGGSTWRKLGRISPPSVKGAVLPSITARGNGEVALAWWGTDQLTDKLLGYGEAYRGWLTYSADALTPKPTFLSAPTTAASVSPQVSNATGCCASGQNFIEYTGVAFTGKNSVRAAFVRWAKGKTPWDKTNPDLVLGKMTIKR